MDSKLNLTVHTADRLHQGNISAPTDARIQEILDSAIENWHLPSDREYVLVCQRLGTQLVTSQTLDQLGVRPDDVIEIQPLPDNGLE